MEKKRRAKIAAHQYKCGSPKLRELMRKSCKIRIKDARRIHSDQYRDVDDVEDTDQSKVDALIRHEIQELEHDIELQDLIYLEIMNEANELYLNDVERLNDYLYEIGENSTDTAFCPICQNNLLKVDGANLICDCGTKVDWNKSINEFYQTIQEHMAKHDSKCSLPLRFFTEQSFRGPVCTVILNAMCDSCDFFCTI